MDAMDEKSGQNPPISCRPKIMLIPCCSLDSRASIRQWNKPEFSAMRDQKIVNMRWMDVIWTQFPHSWRIRCHVKFQQSGRIPNRDRLDKCSCGEDTAAYS